jgi:hypothetical protein
MNICQVCRFRRTLAASALRKNNRMHRFTKRRFATPAIPAVIALILAHFHSVAVADDLPLADKPTVKVVADRKGDTCTATMSMGEAHIDVRSESGIGLARITRLDDSPWPEKIVVHLHLKGLEGFTAGSDLLRLHGALGFPELEAFAAGDHGAFFRVEVKPEYAMPIRRGKDAIEVELPQVLLDPDAKTLYIQWVDFYR